MPATDLMLSNDEINRLKQCEKVIEAGQKTFAEVANALMEIKSLHLYRGKYGNFDLYCKERWGFARNYADKLIRSAEVQKQVQPVLKSMTEGGLRPLTTVPPRQVKKVAGQAIANAKAEGRPVAPRDVKKAVQQYKATETYKDELGRLIPSHLNDLWLRRNEVKGLLADLSKVKSAVKDAEDNQDPLYASIHYQTFMTHIDALYHDLKYAMPYAVCGLCNGAKCKVCKTGLMTKLAWDRNVPEDVKAMVMKAVKK